MQCQKPLFQELVLQSTPALDELIQRPQWCNWISNPGVKTGPEWLRHKAPIQPNGTLAKSNDPKTWHTYAECVAAVPATIVAGGVGGVGFFFANGYCGQDFDHVITGGVCEPWVLAELDKLNSYSEVSTSGTGIHSIGHATLPGAGKSHSSTRLRVEEYASGRYFIVTGFHIAGTPETINDNQAAAVDFYNRIDLIDPVQVAKMVVAQPPFDQFKSALHGRTIDDLIADESVHLLVETQRHNFLNQCVGLLWDGKRSAEELLAIACKIEQRFCSGTREIPDKEVASMVAYVRQRDPSHQSNQKDSPLQAQKKLLLGVPWFTDVDEFFEEKIPSKRKFITDMAGNPILTSSMLAELYAFRGIGKSLFLLAFIRLLIFGGEALGYKSSGGYTVLLCDGELPPQDLQDRLKELVGVSHGLFKMMDTSHLPGNIFPAMSDPDYQKEFIRQVDELKPDIVIFDTLTACFRFDTNDTDMWTLVNQFFIDLRNKEYCTVVSHHAGKNNTQRGRTDAEDNMDVVLKLDMPAGHEPGMGLEFVVTYEKYRPKVQEGTKVLGFQAKLVLGKWEFVIDSERQNIIKAITDGQSWRWIRDNLDVTNKKIAAAVNFMKSTGMPLPPPKPKAKVKKGGGK